MTDKVNETKKTKNTKQTNFIKKWSLTCFAVLLLIVSLFIINVYAKTEVDNSAILYLTNKERSALGLNTLTHSKVLDKAAYNKAKDIFNNQYFDHVSPEGKTPWQFINEAGYDYSYAGENLAINFNELESTHEAWMKSPSHRANIVSPKYQEIGYATVTGQYKGETTTVTVEMFGTTMFDTVINQMSPW